MSSCSAGRRPRVDPGRPRSSGSAYLRVERRRRMVSAAFERVDEKVYKGRVEAGALAVSTSRSGANVIQNTTIASIIGVTEVLATGQRSTERLAYSTGDSHALAIYGAVAAAFFAISFPLTRLAIFLERRLV